MRVSITAQATNSLEVSWGGGISRCCKCDDSLAVIEVVYEEVFHQRSSIGEKNGIQGGQSLKDDVSPCLRATDYKNPHCVWEIVYEDENRQTDSSRTDAE